MKVHLKVILYIVLTMTTMVREYELSESESPAHDKPLEDTQKMVQVLKNLNSQLLTRKISSDLFVQKLKKLRNAVIAKKSTEEKKVKTMKEEESKRSEMKTSIQEAKYNEGSEPVANTNSAESKLQRSQQQHESNKKIAMLSKFLDILEKIIPKQTGQLDVNAIMSLEAIPKTVKIKNEKTGAEMTPIDNKLSAKENHTETNIVFNPNAKTTVNNRTDIMENVNLSETTQSQSSNDIVHSHDTCTKSSRAEVLETKRNSVTDESTIVKQDEQTTLETHFTILPPYRDEKFHDDSTASGEKRSSVTDENLKRKHAEQSTVAPLTTETHHPLDSLPQEGDEQFFDDTDLVDAKPHKHQTERDTSKHGEERVAQNRSQENRRMHSNRHSGGHRIGSNRQHAPAALSFPDGYFTEDGTTTEADDTNDFSDDDKLDGDNYETREEEEEERSSILDTLVIVLMGILLTQCCVLVFLVMLKDKLIISLTFKYGQIKM